jgi:hypothetical protein
VQLSDPSPRHDLDRAPGNASPRPSILFSRLNLRARRGSRPAPARPDPAACMQLRFGQTGHFLGDIEHGAAFGVGALGDPGRGFVADHRIQRGDEDRVACQRGGDAVAPDREPGDRRIGQLRHRRRQQGNRLQQVVRDQRQHHVELEVAALPGHGNRGVIADDLRADHAQRFGNHRIDLARHDRRARLQGRQLDLAQARERPGIHPAQVVADLHQRAGQHVELSRQFHRRILRRDAFEQVVRLGEFRPAGLRQGGAGTARETRIGVDAGSDRGAAERQALQALERVEQPLLRRLQLRRPGAHLLRHGQRHCIHQVGAAGLDDIAQLRGAPVDGLAQVSQRRQQALARRQGRGHLDRAGNHVVGTLPEVDVVIRMYALAAGAGRERGDHLVRIHVRGRAGPGLEHIHRKMCVMGTAGDITRRQRNGARQFWCQVSERGIGLRGCRLDQAEGADEVARHPQPGDREVLHRALGLRAPERVAWHAQLAHAVVLDPFLPRHDHVSCSGVRSIRRRTQRAAV